MPDELVTFANTVLKQQPFSVFLGASVEEAASGHIVLTLPVRGEFYQQHGFVHGGVLSYLADNAISFCGGSVLGTDILTAEYKINYLRPAIGEKLLAVADVVNTGSKLAVCHCDIYAVSGAEKKQVAFALGSVIKTG